jgi:hypothetical protein
MTNQPAKPGPNDAPWRVKQASNNLVRRFGHELGSFDEVVNVVLDTPDTL